MKVNQNVADPKVYFDPSAHSITTFIKWKNEQGEEERFRLNKEICHKWEDIGRLLRIRDSQLIAWEREYLKDQLKCTNTVLLHWLKNPSNCYPKSWKGLDRLLNDAQLGEVASGLKQALASVL